MRSGILHENCITGKSYIINIRGKRFEAQFKGYADGNQYTPLFEIRDGQGNVRVLRECRQE